MRDTLIRVREMRPESGEAPELPAWVIAVGSGAGAALTSATVLVAVAVLGWLTGAGGDAGAGATIAAGLAAWAFAHGAPLAVEEGSIGLVPWLLALWPLLCAWWSAQRIAPGREEAPPRLRGFGGLRRDVALTSGAFVAGYTLAASLLAVGAHLGGARPSIPATAVGGLVLAALAYVLALAPRHRGEAADLAPRLAWALREYVPAWATRAVRPAVGVVLLTLAAGLVLVVTAVVLGYGAVSEVYLRIDGGIVGTTLVTLAQLAYLPTLAVWGASWLAGPGFTLGGDTAVTWTQSEPGIIPLVPVLGAVPPPGDLPPWTPVVVVVPILLGVVLGIWCLRRADGTWAGAARLTGVACLLYALALLALAAGASGSVGGGRFAHVGVDAVATTLVLTVEVGLTAFAIVALGALRRRRVRAEA